MRSPLDEVCLQAKLLGLHGGIVGLGTERVASFLANAVEPPPLQAIEGAVAMLEVRFVCVCVCEMCFECYIVCIPSLFSLISLSPTTQPLEYPLSLSHTHTHIHTLSHSHTLSRTLSLTHTLRL